jgi:DNA polymerase III subunit epsilon
LTKLNLIKDLVFFDIESTGLNVIRDRIVQIALIKYSKDGESTEELNLLINPQIPISEESIAIHGITPEMLADKPTFEQVGQQIFDFIGDADLAGYNSDRFDVPMLMEELARVGLDLGIEHRNLIDVQKIFYKMEPRTLKAAYSLYCGKELIDAHDALADVRATADVFKGQLIKYQATDHVDGDGYITETPISNDIPKIAEFLYDKGSLDVTQRLRFDTNGTIVFNFGKHIGQPVAKTVYNDRQYFHWIMDKDFSYQVKKIVRRLLEDYEKEMKLKNTKA